MTTNQGAKTQSDRHKSARIGAAPQGVGSTMRGLTQRIDSTDWRAVMQPIEWRAIPGYEGIYEVSERGDIRTVKQRGAVKAGQILRPTFHKHGYPEYHLFAGGSRRRIRAHRAVAAAFLGSVDGLVVRHRDDDPTNNHYSNLELGTQRENVHDAVMRGRNSCGNAKKTHCKNGHEFNTENTHIAPNGSRVCRPCARAYLQARRSAARALAANGKAA